jgi:hypothetical protein
MISSGFDTLIVGHENAPEAIRRLSDDREAWIERREGYLARHQDAAEATVLFDLPVENLAEQHARVLAGMWDSSGESVPGN